MVLKSIRGILSTHPLSIYSILVRYRSLRKMENGIGGGGGGGGFYAALKSSIGILSTHPLSIYSISMFIVTV